VGFAAPLLVVRIPRWVAAEGLVLVGILVSGAAGLTALLVRLTLSGTAAVRRSGGARPSQLLLDLIMHQQALWAVPEGVDDNVTVLDVFAAVVAQMVSVTVVQLSLLDARGETPLTGGGGNPAGSASIISDSVSFHDSVVGSGACFQGFDLSDGHRDVLA